MRGCGYPRRIDCAHAHVIDGLAQATGVAMFIAGLALPKKTLVRNDVFTSGLTLVPRPMTLGRAGAGLGLLGAF